MLGHALCEMVADSLRWTPVYLQLMAVDKGWYYAVNSSDVKIGEPVAKEDADTISWRPCLLRSWISLVNGWHTAPRSQVFSIGALGQLSRSVRRARTPYRLKITLAITPGMQLVRGVKELEFTNLATPEMVDTVNGFPGLSRLRLVVPPGQARLFNAIVMPPNLVELVVESHRPVDTIDGSSIATVQHSLQNLTISSIDCDVSHLDFPNLTHLDLSRNPQSNLPGFIARHPRIVSLRLQGMDVSEELHQAVSCLRRLHQIQWQGRAVELKTLAPTMADRVEAAGGIMSLGYRELPPLLEGTPIRVHRTRRTAPTMQLASPTQMPPDIENADEWQAGWLAGWHAAQLAVQRAMQAALTHYVPVVPASAADSRPAAASAAAASAAPEPVAASAAPEPAAASAAPEPAAAASATALARRSPLRRPAQFADASLPTVWDLPDGNIDAQLEARMSERSRQTRQARSKFLETVH
jgi:hypothetical protein